MTLFQGTSAIDMQRAIIGTLDQLSQVAELEACTFNHPWSESALKIFFESESAFCTLCLVDGELASYCTVVTVLDEAQIVNVATAEKHKGLGYAKDVIELVVSESIRRNIVSISLEVRESNFAAISLYEKKGFIAVGKRKGFYTEPKEDALVMIKNLD